MTLPPKRFQSTEDPKYDPIRWRPWFGKLETRRKKLPFLEQAAAMAQITSQKNAAESFKIDPRELRDYMAFMAGESSITVEKRKTFQAVIDEAYAGFKANPDETFTKYLEDTATFFGLKPRHVTEAWETDLTYYPTGYVV